MKFVNLTPHPVAVFVEDEYGDTVGTVGHGSKAREARFREIANFEPTGTVARAAQRDDVVGAVEIGGEGVDVVRTTFGETTDLPEPEEATYYVVSIRTAQAAKAAGRTTADLLVTSGPVRDAEGRILGCTRFATV